MKVSVCIITYRRKEELINLLKSISELNLDQFPNLELELIVVENEVDGYINQVKREITGRFPWEIRFDVEGKKGIPFARNRSVELVSGKSDYVVFVDDDETVAENWLIQLLITQEKYNADVVQGPVIPKYNSRINWLFKKSGVFERKRYKTGTKKTTAATNNLLIKKEILDDFNKPFCEKMVKIGGSDSLLFKQVARKGLEIIWCDEAEVYERIDKKRANLHWLARRFLRHGATTVVVYKKLEGQKYIIFKILPKSVTQIFYAVLTFPLSIFYPPLALTRMKYFLVGIGSLLAILNFSFKEY